MATILERIDDAVKRIPDPSETEVLQALAWRLRDPEYLKHEDALSVTTLNQLAEQRLRLIKEIPHDEH